MKCQKKRIASVHFVFVFVTAFKELQSANQVYYFIKSCSFYIQFHHIKILDCEVMPRRVRPPQRHVTAAKLSTLKPKAAAEKAAEAAPEPPAKPAKAPSLPKQQKVSVPPRATRRSRSESRISSNSSDDDYQPSIRVRNASESRFDRSRQDVQILQDIHRLQSTTQLLIPKLPFARVIREVLMQYMYRDFRITPECLCAIQEAAEMYMVQVFEDSYRCCLHRSRVTLGVPDMKLALYLREKWRP